MKFKTTILFFLLSFTGSSLALEEIGSCSYPGPALSLHVAANKAYIAHGSPMLKIIDVADPYNPYVAGLVDSNGYVFHHFAEEDHAYVPRDGFGLYIYDTEDIFNPELISVFDSCSYLGLHDVYVVKNTAYMITCRSLVIIDISDPVNPLLISEFCPYNGGCNNDLKVREPYAFYTRANKLEIINVENPNEPEYASIYYSPTNSIISDFDIAGMYGYLTFSSHDTLEVVELTDPYNPMYVGSYLMPAGSWRIYCTRTHAFIITDDYPGSGKWISIYDISNPYQVRFLYNYELSGYDPWSYYDIWADDYYVYLTQHDQFTIFGFDPTGLEEIARIPTGFSLSPNYPNPFNASTTISYSLPQPSDVRLDIYDILGRKVQTLYDGRQAAGEHSIIWDAEGFSSGMYFYKITSGRFEQSEKMTLLK